MASILEKYFAPASSPSISTFVGILEMPSLDCHVEIFWVDERMGIAIFLLSHDHRMGPVCKSFTVFSRACSEQR